VEDMRSKSEEDDLRGHSDRIIKNASTVKFTNSAPATC